MAAALVAAVVPMVTTWLTPAATALSKIAGKSSLNRSSSK
jgi:hypothetical protein